MDTTLPLDLNDGDADRRASSAGMQLALFDAADLQDNLLMVANDLDRLQGLLGEACDGLMAAFLRATDSLRENASAARAGDATTAALAHLRKGVTALQFQDLATQLLAHTQQRLRHCTDQLADSALDFDEDGRGHVEPLPMRANPVTQDEMDAGSVTLF